MWGDLDEEAGVHETGPKLFHFLDLVEEVLVSLHSSQDLEGVGRFRRQRQEGGQFGRRAYRSAQRGLPGGHGRTCAARGGGRDKFTRSRYNVHPCSIPACAWLQNRQGTLGSPAGPAASGILLFLENENLAVATYNTSEFRKGLKVQIEGDPYLMLECNFVKVLGRERVVGRPFLYGTTRVFLLHFGLKKLSELPQLSEFEELIGETLSPEVFAAAAPSELELIEEESSEPTQLPEQQESADFVSSND